jgi:hypothetical protein
LIGGSDAPELSSMGAAGRPAGDHLVPVAYLILYGDLQIGEGLAVLAEELLDLLGTAFLLRAVGLVGDVPSAKISSATSTLPLAHPSST